MNRISASIAVAMLALAGCETAGEDDPALAGAVIEGDAAAAEALALPPEGASEPALAGAAPGPGALTGYTVSVVSGTQPDGQPFHLRRGNRTLWLYESGETSVPMDVTETTDTTIEMVGIGDWTGRIKIDLAANQVEVGDRDWTRVEKLPIQSAN